MSIRTSMGALGLALTLAAQPAAAVDARVRLAQYRHTAWRVQDGAFESAPNVIAQTADGYIWIGTNSGLVRFDGVRFQPWTPPQKNLFGTAVLSNVSISWFGNQDPSTSACLRSSFSILELKHWRSRSDNRSG